MKKARLLFIRLAHQVESWERPILSHKELIIDECLVVLVVFVWLGAMTLLP